MMYLVKSDAYAHMLFDINRYINEIHSINPDIATYLENTEIFLSSRVHFPSDRYNTKTSNTT